METGYGNKTQVPIEFYPEFGNIYYTFVRTTLLHNLSLLKYNLSGYIYKIK